MALQDVCLFAIIMPKSAGTLNIVRMTEWTFIFIKLGLLLLKGHGWSHSLIHCHALLKLKNPYEFKLRDKMIYTIHAQTFSRNIFVANMTVAVHFKACYWCKNAWIHLNTGFLHLYWNIFLVQSITFVMFSWSHLTEVLSVFVWELDYYGGLNYKSV